MDGNHACVVEGLVGGDRVHVHECLSLTQLLHIHVCRWCGLKKKIQLNSFLLKKMMSC